MRNIFVVIVNLVLAGSALAASTSGQMSGDRFPLGPDPKLTPGSMCQSDSTRHPENIPYCKRSVSSSDKWFVIGTYNKLGANISEKNRGHFKIDHFIPLCIGGSNRLDNLWPQHESIYIQTDDVEHMTCELVSRGEMRQQDAIDLVVTAKLHLEQAAGIKAQLKSRLHR